MRKTAREAAYKVIFSYLFTRERDEEFKVRMYREAKLGEEDAAFADRILACVFEHEPEFLEEMGGLAKGFKVERIYPADKCAMLIAMAEMTYMKDVPAVVSIDEAVGLARKYSTENSLSFVNGILGSYLKKSKAEERK